MLEFHEFVDGNKLKDDLLSVMKKIDLIIINDGEVRMLAQDDKI